LHAETKGDVNDIGQMQRKKISVKAVNKAQKGSLVFLAVSHRVARRLFRLSVSVFVGTQNMRD
jgi:hypothetical protein